MMPKLRTVRNGTATAASTTATPASSPNSRLTQRRRCEIRRVAAALAIELHRLMEDFPGRRRAGLHDVDELDPDGRILLVHRLGEKELGVGRDRQRRRRAAADAVFVVERLAVPNCALKSAPVGRVVDCP